MKDRQIHTVGPQPRVPIVSSVLHWFAIPAIVYLRSGFGFSFLSPKSVFLAFSWATILFAIYTWLEADAWQIYWALSCFGTGAVVLYASHLLIAFWGETQGRPTYDQICAGLDAERQAANLSCCEAMIASGRYDIDARTAMQALEALGDGLWLGVASAGSGMTGRVTPQDAQRIMKAALKALFPKHYGKFP